MSYNTKNYTEQGGDVTHIGGKIILEDGAEAEGFPNTDTPATETVLGGIKAAAKGEGDTVPCKIGDDDMLYVPAYPVAENVAEVTPAGETPTAVESAVNGILTALKAAGLMAEE